MFPITVATDPSEILKVKAPVLLDVADKLKSGSRVVFVIFENVIPGFVLTTVRVIDAEAEL